MATLIGHVTPWSAAAADRLARLQDVYLAGGADADTARRQALRAPLRGGAAAGLDERVRRRLPAPGGALRRDGPAGVGDAPPGGQPRAPAASRPPEDASGPRAPQAGPRRVRIAHAPSPAGAHASTAWPGPREAPRHVAGRGLVVDEDAQDRARRRASRARDAPSGTCRGRPRRGGRAPRPAAASGADPVVYRSTGSAGVRRPFHPRAVVVADARVPDEPERQVGLRRAHPAPAVDHAPSGPAGGRRPRRAPGARRHP